MGGTENGSKDLGTGEGEVTTIYSTHCSSTLVLIKDAVMGQIDHSHVHITDNKSASQNEVLTMACMMR